MALAVDDFYLNYIESKMKKRSYEWTRLENVILWRTYDAFIFDGGAFYARILDKIINDLVPTGVMNYLIENYYTKRWKLEKIEKEPKVLSMDDLAFGFNIWLVFCVVTVVAFLGEILHKYTRKYKKITFAKIHPENLNRNNKIYKLNPQLMAVFRTNSKIGYNYTY